MHQEEFIVRCTLDHPYLGGINEYLDNIYATSKLQNRVLLRKYDICYLPIIDSLQHSRIGEKVWYQRPS